MGLARPAAVNKILLTTTYRCGKMYLNYDTRRNPSG